MSDPSGRYTIVFNGEVYNFKDIREELEKAGERFHSHTDTEVVLRSYILWGKLALNRFNGFFAFAIYDKQKNELFIARDRFGIKPLLYSPPSPGERGSGGEAGEAPSERPVGAADFFFASEMKAIMAYPISHDLDRVSLLQYLHLNYIPAPHSIFRNVKKLLPGHFITVNNSGLQIKKWYRLPEASPAGVDLTYEEQCDALKMLLEASVKRRLISDVPLGAFLSGGIDSSIIVALGSQHTSKLKTFSIGFPDQPYFDETEYANAVAQKYATDHTVFPVTRSDLLANLEPTLDYIDEPFADSSALLVNMLSRHTRQRVTVSLSGDGGDELFAGYRKHRAEFLIRKGGPRPALIQALRPLWKALPKSREGRFTDLIRKLERFADAARLPSDERYWRLCGYASDLEALSMLRLEDETLPSSLLPELMSRKAIITGRIIAEDTLSSALRTDLEFILPNDMLHKVDLMSMAHSLEVRVPFLDHHVVEFVTALPEQSKINPSVQKRILRDTFGHLLPSQLLSRPKRGFEVPLLNWLRHDLREMTNDLLGNRFIQEQGLFSPESIGRLRSQLHSRNPGDAPSRIYGLIVFQHWWRRYLS